MPEKRFPLPVTKHVMEFLNSQGFQNFPPNTYLAAMPHLLPDVEDLMTAVIELGIPPENITLLGKQYSQVDSIRDRMKELGINVVDYTPAKAGEYYPTMKKDSTQFWQTVQHSLQSAPGEKNLLVLDDGGKVISGIPDMILNDPECKIVGVEQTSNGYNHLVENGYGIDVVVPAKSALKLEFEPPLIASASLAKLVEKLGSLHHRKTGVVGIGKIGGSVARTLAANQNDVYVFDKAVTIENGKLADPRFLIPPDITVCETPGNGLALEDAKIVRESNPPGGLRYYVCNSLEQLVQKSNYVFGATGRDTFAGVDCDNFRFNDAGKTPCETRFISVSSGDIEFLGLLEWMKKQENFNHHSAMEKNGSRWDITCKTRDNLLRVVQQGFPINFDGKSGSGTPEKVQLITGFLLGSLAQASMYGQQFPVASRNNQKHIMMFSPELQREILEKWLENVPEVRNLFNDETLRKALGSSDWFRQRSEGNEIPVFLSDIPDPLVAATAVTRADISEKTMKRAI